MKLPPLLSLSVAGILIRLSRFSWRVVRRFAGNHGLLLAGGVGYNVLLCCCPSFRCWPFWGYCSRAW